MWAQPHAVGLDCDAYESCTVRGSTWDLSPLAEQWGFSMEQCFQGWQEAWVVSSGELTLCLGSIRVRGQLSARGRGAAAETEEEPC